VAFLREVPVLEFLFGSWVIFELPGFTTAASGTPQAPARIMKSPRVVPGGSFSFSYP
jgi:hypothetical protein